MLYDLLKDFAKDIIKNFPANPNKQTEKIEKIKPEIVLDKIDSEKIRIDDKKFYEQFKKQFGKLTQQQVENLNFIIACIEMYDKNYFTIQQLAYILATAYHETGTTFKPIVENLNYSAQRLRQVWPKWFKSLPDAKKYEKNPEKLANYIYGATTTIGKNLGNTAFYGDGWKYRGRGFVQLTGRVNYARLSQRLGKNFVSNPDLVLQPDIAWQVLVISMIEGTLVPGVKLSNYISANKVDYYNARRVVNILDRAGDIANYAKKFEIILKASMLN